MASPFPGMDPYLEDRTIFPGFHHYLADEFVGQLNARIGPKYFAEVEVRTVFESVTADELPSALPDVAIARETQVAYVTMTTDMAITPPLLRRAALARVPTKLRSVRVYLTESKELVTAIEILSPYNKRAGEGLREYRRKRWKLLTSPVHLVEIDLLRGGARVGLELLDPLLDADYVCVVNRAREKGMTRVSDIWPLALNAPLPVLPIPLREPDPDAPLGLNAALKSIYSRAGYDWRIKYQNPAPPPELRPAMVEWVKQRVAEASAKSQSESNDV